MYDTIEQIVDTSTAARYDFFKPDTMRIFQTTVCGDVIGGNMFITAERQSPASQRLYTVRRVWPDGRIGTVGRFQQYDSYERARDAARQAGRGGEGGAT